VRAVRLLANPSPQPSPNGRGSFRKTLERLREDLRPLLLLTQTLIEEHTGIAQERSPAFGQDQPLAANLNQAVADQRPEITPGVIALVGKQANLEVGHEGENLFAQAPIFFR
jgi:hypothetical protein